MEISSKLAKSMAEIHGELVKDGYEFSQEDLFHAERYMSFNLCSILNVISILKRLIYPDTPDISCFSLKQQMLSFLSLYIN